MAACVLAIETLQATHNEEHLLAIKNLKTTPLRAGI
jgi:hypothetical protein